MRNPGVIRERNWCKRKNEQSKGFFKKEVPLKNTLVIFLFLSNLTLEDDRRLFFLHNRRLQSNRDFHSKRRSELRRSEPLPILLVPPDYLMKICINSRHDKNQSRGGNRAQLSLLTGSEHNFTALSSIHY